MINSIYLKNFKAHAETNIDLGNLTIICGQNGVGKSSIIQSLLLLRQSHQKNRLTKGLDLNRPLCEIGSSQDALYQDAKDYFLEIGLKIENIDNHWRFEFNASKSDSTFMKKLSSDHPPQKKFINNCSLFTKNFQYLSAARLSPRESYPKDDYDVEINKQLSIEKGQGELVAHFLNHYRTKKVNSSLLNANSKYDELFAQTTAWEREISNNINIRVNLLGKGFEILYYFDRKDDVHTNDFKAENVGFGITYALPLIVAILAAEKDSLIIIENPEAHLHPHAQAKLTELMCLAAQAGIQIIIETHSDHIINGTLVACKKEQIEKENVKIWYFDTDESTHAARAKEVNITEDIRLEDSPEGFFDQLGKDLRILMR